ncbi:MAG TPA: hypothetical protein VK932_26635, partial [Kofleriaceae bacterium]|nr:hypothetical protein [Kofleriaceae bacterium]
AGLRRALAAMTDPDPDKRPQRARDVVALLAKSPPPAEPAREREGRALERTRSGPPARRIFADVGEPLGTLLRFGVLGFGAGGWLGMAGLRVSLTITIWIAALLVFPARSTSKKMVAVGRELDAMLAEGQGGFTDMMRTAMARRP